MELVPCYRCNRYHRIVPLGNMLSHHKGIVLKSSRPSLPLKKAPPLTPALFNGLYTPFGSPVCGGQKPQERGRKPPSGAQNRYALRLAGHQSPRQIVRDGTAWVLLACGLLMDLLILACELVMDWGLLACGLVMELLLYRCW